MNTLFKSIYFLIILCIHSYTAIAQEVSLVIRDVKVYTEPYSVPIGKGHIFIENNKIIKIVSIDDYPIPDDVEIINGEGKIAIAGFWNSHVHLIEPKWQNIKELTKETLETNLASMLTSWGFVYAFDLAQFKLDDIKMLQERINVGEVKGPTIFYVGVPITAKTPFYVNPVKLPELKNITEVESHIKSQIENGASGIKIWSGSPLGNTTAYLSNSLIARASELTRLHNIPLFAHPTTNIGVKNAINNGVTILSHVSPSDLISWDEELLEVMITKNVALIPTLKLFKWELERDLSTFSDTLVKTAIKQLSDFKQKGGLILFGTDVGYMSEYNPSDEYIFMEKAGLSFQDIIAALTTNPTKVFGFEKNKGKLKEGFDADIILLDSDPSKNVLNFTDVFLSIHNGKIIYSRQK